MHIPDINHVQGLAYVAHLARGTLQTGVASASTPVLQLVPASVAPQAAVATAQVQPYHARATRVKKVVNIKFRGGEGAKRISATYLHWHCPSM